MIPDGNDGAATGLFRLDERVAELSAKSDDLERPEAVVDFAVFRFRFLSRQFHAMIVPRPFDHVFMFKILIPQTSR